MERATRIIGGEKNSKTGLKWSREELCEVLNVYVSDRTLKIHETNKSVIELSKKLGRTARSVEAQLIMFRTLDRNGFYGYKNMNLITKKLWKEYINHNLI